MSQKAIFLLRQISVLILINTIRANGLITILPHTFILPSKFCALLVQKFIKKKKRCASERNDIPLIWLGIFEIKVAKLLHYKRQFWMPIM